MYIRTVLLLIIPLLVYFFDISKRRVYCFNLSKKGVFIGDGGNIRRNTVITRQKQSESGNIKHSFKMKY